MVHLPMDLSHLVAVDDITRIDYYVRFGQCGWPSMEDLIEARALKCVCMRLLWSTEDYGIFTGDIIFLHRLPCSKKFINIILKVLTLSENIGSPISRFLVAFYLRKNSAPHACPIVHHMFQNLTDILRCSPSYYQMLLLLDICGRLITRDAPDADFKLVDRPHKKYSRLPIEKFVMACSRIKTWNNGNFKVYLTNVSQFRNNPVTHYGYFILILVVTDGYFTVPKYNKKYRTLMDHYHRSCEVHRFIHKRGFIVSMPVEPVLICPTRNITRFFNITRQLTQELQMLLSHRLAGSPEWLIKTSDVDSLLPWAFGMN